VLRPERKTLRSNIRLPVSSATFASGQKAEEKRKSLQNKLLHLFANFSFKTRVQQCSFCWLARNSMEKNEKKHSTSETF
jgi:hypothetical protein